MKSRFSETEATVAAQHRQARGQRIAFTIDPVIKARAFATRKHGSRSGIAG